MDNYHDVAGMPLFADDLVVYEIAVKGFTSPNGPESGTFRSAAEKIPYLADLGITSIWLSGHSLSDSHHFYNIWTSYACIRPDEIDPSLGTESDLRDLIAAAHDHGIRVFLEVITHGVMNDSPLIDQHPDWFKGGSWGMTDYDWFGGHRDLDRWWVDIWTKAVVDWGADGFRVDCMMYRPDLWAKIRWNAKRAGREIFIISESSLAERGVSDTMQWLTLVSDNTGLHIDHPILKDAAGYLNDRRLMNGRDKPFVILTYADGEKVSSVNGQITVESCRICEEFIDNDHSSYAPEAIRVTVGNLDQQKEVLGASVYYGEAHSESGSADEPLTLTRKDAGRLELQGHVHLQKGTVLSVQLSCHDNGWDGWPTDRNPFGIQGSRYLMGYGGLMAPVIPFMMSGEEFNAEYRPIPWHRNDLYGKKEDGTGRWLYGAWIQWDDLRKEESSDMYEDTKKLLSIRKRFRGLIKPYRFGEEPAASIVPLKYTAKVSLPVPYAYRSNEEMLLIAANPTDEAIEVSIFIGENRSEASTLFGRYPAEITDKTVNVKIGPDKSREGGLIVVHLK